MMHRRDRWQQNSDAQFLWNIPPISFRSPNLTSQRYPVEIQLQLNAPFFYSIEEIEKNSTIFSTALQAISM